MEKRVRKAIIPAAGLGTRFLPATKAQPKEMLPILNKPSIQHIVEEAVASGIEDILIVTGRGKRVIEDHFDNAFELEATLQNKGKFRLLEQVQSTNHMARIHYIRQHEPQGLGHAIWCGKSFIGNEPFAVLLGDDIVVHKEPCLKQLIKVYEETVSSVIGVQKVPMEEVSRYGVIKPIESRGRLHEVSHLKEKPSPEEAPSNLAIIGRYVLTPAIFDSLSGQKPGAGGEIQLTDALDVLNRTQRIFAFEFKGSRYDVGEVPGFVKATIELALRDPSMKEEIWQYLQQLTKGGMPYEQQHA
jgi:UTP--glucose-1-phosphate uridylyltransferase